MITIKSMYLMYKKKDVNYCKKNLALINNDFQGNV